MNQVIRLINTAVNIYSHCWLFITLTLAAFEQCVALSMGLSLVPVMRMTQCIYGPSHLYLPMKLPHFQDPILILQVRVEGLS